MQKNLKKESILEKFNFLSTVGQVPIKNRFDPENWLNNFEPDEEQYALCLLDSFLYFSEDTCKELLKSNFQKLFRTISGFKEKSKEGRYKYEDFVDEINVIPVFLKGPSDSGYVFARMARDFIKFPEERIPNFNKNLPKDMFIRNKKKQKIVFVDDFIGTGDQFINFMESEFTFKKKKRKLCEILTANDSETYFCPILSTSMGLDKIKQKYKFIKIICPYFLKNNYSVLDDSSLVWTENLRKDSIKFLREVNQRAGILQAQIDWRGYGGLGLTVSFFHSTPDSTLPIFTWDKNGWNPLIK